MLEVVKDRSLELSVVAPCFNEAGNLRELVQRLVETFRQNKIAAEVVLVNDGSRDNSAAVLTELAAQYEELRYYSHQTNLGIEAAWKTGVDRARGTYVCLIDADLQNLPEDVGRLLAELKFSRVDFVQGYRSAVGRLKDSRYILSKGLNFLLNTLFPIRLRDAKSGFVIAPRAVMIDILQHRYRYRYFQSFIAVAAAAKGYRIREIETLFESRLVGESFMSRFPLKVVLFCLTDLLKAFVEYRLSFKREDFLAHFLRQHPPTRHSPRPALWRRVLLDAFFLSMPLHKWTITRQARHYYRELRESQWLDPQKMRELQEQKLARLVHQAYYHSAWYRRLFDEHGIKPESIRTLEDLQRLPLLSKDQVRRNLHFSLLSDNHDKRRILRVNTSGSTGEPFMFYADQHQLEIRWASTLRCLEWTGYQFGDRQVRLWHQTLGMSRTQVLRERLDAWFNRRVFVPAYRMSATEIEKLIAVLESHDPVLIDGYAESFNLIGRYLREHSGRQLKLPSLKGIVSSAQALPEESRQIIESSFGCPVYDKYGSREFSGIAYECEHRTGHHVNAESYIVEILKDGRPALPGEIGEVVITDLNNYCVPLIRYRVGDLARALDPAVTCPCGRGLPLIGEIEGRIQAIIVGTNGNFLPGTFFAHLFKDYDHMLRQYQVLQTERDSIDLKVVRAPRFDERTFEQLLNVIRDHLGAEMRINLQLIDEIPLVRTGKHQGSLSLLPLDFQQIELSGLKRGNSDLH